MKKKRMRLAFEEGTNGFISSKIPPDQILQIEDFDGNILYKKAEQ